jgi:hypothetical protein
MSVLVCALIMRTVFEFCSWSLVENGLKMTQLINLTADVNR